MTNYIVNYADAGFTQVTVPASSIDDLRAKMTQMFADAANAEVSIEGNTVTFSVRKGSKA